jgi:hypothetical protein
MTMDPPTYLQFYNHEYSKDGFPIRIREKEEEKKSEKWCDLFEEQKAKEIQPKEAKRESQKQSCDLKKIKKNK